MLLIDSDARLLVFYCALLVDGRLRRIKLCGLPLSPRSETCVVYGVAVSARGTHR